MERCPQFKIFFFCKLQNKGELDEGSQKLQTSSDKINIRDVICYVMVIVHIAVWYI